MTPEQYRDRIEDIETYVRHTGFGCDRSCKRDFYEHAESLMAYLATLVEAEFYGVGNPELNVIDCPCNMRPRFQSDAHRFHQKWMADFGPR